MYLQFKYVDSISAGRFNHLIIYWNLYGVVFLFFTCIIQIYSSHIGSRLWKTMASIL